MILSSRPAWEPGKFPTLERAVKEMAYDNGAIHRNNTEEALLKRVMTYLVSTFKATELQQVDMELGALTDDDLETLVCGEQGVVKVSDLSEKVLNEAFDAL